MSPSHLHRTASVYVRQSTGQQVRYPPESGRRQDALADRARALGFPQVVGIDEDVGRSGSGRQERSGFGPLLATVCQGNLGAVWALEASRLVRHNRDWQHVIDLCALTDTLRIDGDGMHDPRLLNDRLVLGMTGAMAAYELGLMRQRARQAFEENIRRGHVMWEVPEGVGAPRTSVSKRSRPARCSKPWPGYSNHFANWGVPVRPCSGPVMNNCRCLKCNPQRRDKRLSGVCPVHIGSTRC
jgi:DNA invertase Pin-like site-specific DNA recombinase